MGKVTCTVRTENPFQTGRGVLYTVEFSYDIFPHYPRGTILKSDHVYLLVSRINYTIPSGSAYVYTDVPVSTPFEEVDPDDSNIPIWIQLLHAASQDEISWKTITTLHAAFNQIRKNTTLTTLSDTIPVPPVRSGSITTRFGNTLPQSYATTLTKSPSLTLEHPMATVLEALHVDPSLKFVIRQESSLFPRGWIRLDQSPTIEELFILFLYGKVKGYTQALTTSTTTDALLPHLLTLLRADGFLDDTSTLHQALTTLRNTGALTSHHIPFELLHTLHYLVRVLKPMRGSP